MLPEKSSNQKKHCRTIFGWAILTSTEDCKSLTVRSHYLINTCLKHSRARTATQTHDKVNISDTPQAPRLLEQEPRGTSMQGTYLLVWEAEQATAAESIKRQLFLSRLMPDCVQVRLIALDAVLCTVLNTQHFLNKIHIYPLRTDSGLIQAGIRLLSAVRLPRTLISSLCLMGGLWCLNEAKRNLIISP